MKVSRAEGLAWRNVDGETVVIHLRRRWIFGLDDAGGELWAALSEPRSLEELRSMVGESPTVIDAVDRFVADLAGEGLVTSEAELAANGDDAEVVELHPPRILWREELRQFAGQCHLVFGQSHQCNQHPGAS
jgi:hypothetical protein